MSSTARRHRNPIDHPGRAIAVLVIAGAIGLISVVLVRGLGLGCDIHQRTLCSPPQHQQLPLRLQPSPSTLASLPVPAPSSALASLPVTAPPSDGSSGPAVQFAPCRASNLQVVAGQGGAATGNLSQPFDITNVGTAGCALQGYPTALDGWQAGAWHRLKIEDGTFFYVEETTPPPVELVHGATRGAHHWHRRCLQRRRHR